MTSTVAGISARAEELAARVEAFVRQTVIPYEKDARRTSHGTTCVTTQCQPCADPFADADQDGDVDPNDFGVFQRCYAIVAGLGPCTCFDEDADTDVDAADLDAFRLCATRAGVPANPCCDGGQGCP